MRKSVILCLLAAFAVQPAIAETAEEKGLRIATAADKRDSGWGDMTANMKMILKNRAGNTSVRTIRTKTLEVSGDGDKSLSLFDDPADVKGTAMLTFSHGLKPDDQWLYLPAIKRVKRISSKNKSGPFMGSEFAFEDLGSQEIEKYSYRYLAEESCGSGWKCHKIERTPAYKYSGYTRQVSWVDQSDYQLRKVEFYDRRGDLLKVLELSDYRNYEGIWRAHKLSMSNVQTNKQTDLIYGDYTFNTGLAENDFVKVLLSLLR